MMICLMLLFSSVKRPFLVLKREPPSRAVLGLIAATSNVGVADCATQSAAGRNTHVSTARIMPIRRYHIGIRWLLIDRFPWASPRDPPPASRSVLSALRVSIQ